MATLTELHARIDAATAALDLNDWEAVQRNVQAGLLILVALPDSTFDGNDQIRFDRQGANQILQAMQRQAQAALFSQNCGEDTLIRYQRG